MEYSDFGTTTIDLDFSPLLGGSGPELPEGVPEDAFGVFEDEDGEFRLELTTTSLTVNGTKIAEFELALDSYDSWVLTFDYDGKTFECNFGESMFGDPAYWWIMSDDFSVMVTAYKVS